MKERKKERKKKQLDRRQQRKILVGRYERGKEWDHLQAHIQRLLLSLRVKHYIDERRIHTDKEITISSRYPKQHRQAQINT